VVAMLCRIRGGGFCLFLPGVDYAEVSQGDLSSWTNTGITILV
jgi:hypothetical protein